MGDDRARQRMADDQRMTNAELTQAFGDDPGLIGRFGRGDAGSPLTVPMARPIDGDHPIAGR